MSNIENFLQEFRQTKVKGKANIDLFQKLVKGFEAIDNDLKENSEKISVCRRKIDSLSKQNEHTNRMVCLLRESADRTDMNLRKLNAKTNPLTDWRNDFESLSINVRNNNSCLDKIQSDLEFSKVRLSLVQRDLQKLSDNNTNNDTSPAVTEKIRDTAEFKEQSEYDNIDYFDFENHFRGSIESIKKSQRIYLEYFEDKKCVVDIGCGRGEFLSLLQENGINAKGVDIYEPYVEYCKMKGLDAVCSDGADFLSTLSEVDGIFIGQVVEHLETSQIIRLCSNAYEKLSDGGCIVIETPNPTSLAIYTNAFYIDPSHVKPVHPLTLKYHLEKAGFKNINIIYTDGSRPPYSIPELKCQSAENIEEFNQAMKSVSDIMFGSQDYAVVAVK